MHSETEGVNVKKIDLFQTESVIIAFIFIIYYCNVIIFIFLEEK